MPARSELITPGAPAPMPLDIHVVSHTHWDREWYHSFDRFRQQLVRLIDELVDDPPTQGSSFLLDGQAILLDDYLEVRRSRLDRVGDLLRARRVEAGPWYVLADELIPSGEALVRNLLAGRRALERHGAAAPGVLYCPDSFGHPAALPDIASGFGFGVVVLWRGYGGARWPSGDTARWKGLGGATVLLYQLSREGYELGAALPTEVEPAADRWAHIRGELAPRATVGIALLLNGADHHARQRGLGGAIAALATVARSDMVHESSLDAFGRAVAERAASSVVPLVAGELRDSYGFAWTLQGTFASRTHQKRANALAERALVRSAEPWTALARLAGAPSRRDLIDTAWRTLLRTHPHDTLCGCSIDGVAVAADVRFAAALVQAEGLRDDAIADLIGYDADRAREHRGAWRPVAVIRNEAARPRGGVVVFDVVQFLADEPVGPGSAAVTPPRSPGPEPSLHVEGSRGLQVLSRRLGRERIEAPRHYPDNDWVTRTRVAAFVEAIPGYGLVGIPITTGRRTRGSRLAHAVRATGKALTNGLLRVEAAADGRTRIEAGRPIESLLMIEDRVDSGDLYTPSPRETARVARCTRSQLVHRGPVLGELLTRWKLGPPRAHARSTRGDALDIAFIIEAESPVLRIRVEGHNTAPDHRLRLGLRTGIANARVWADAAFGLVARRQPVISPEESRTERVPPTAPMHRYVSLFSDDAGATVFGDGLAEYEATEDGTVFVTLVRAVGELSKSDLPERPGHAGWPAPTPAAQEYGVFRAHLGLLLHGPRTRSVIQQVEEAADAVLTPLVGATLRSACFVPAPTFGVELHGDGLALSAIKESEDGASTVLRCVNLTDEAQSGSWRLARPVAAAWYARLDETPLEASVAAPGVGAPELDGSTVRFRAEPGAIVTILVR